MKGAGLTLVCLGFAAAANCAADGRSPRTVRLAVPPSVAGQAEAVAAGDSAPAAPVLMIEGLEVVPGEALTVRVLAPAEAGSDEEPRLLGTAATVGSIGADPEAPPERVTFAIPLDEAASRLLAGEDEVTLTLEGAVETGDRSGPRELTFERAYFHEPRPDPPDR